MEERDFDNDVKEPQDDFFLKLKSINDYYINVKGNSIIINNNKPEYNNIYTKYLKNNNIQILIEINKKK
jgi:hypothetical protein